MSNEPNQTKILRDILIVDEDENLLQHLTTLLSKFYNVRPVTNGKAGLELLQKGYKPAVILASQTMQGISGGQFLAESLNFTPDSIRIIITSLTHPKEIVPAMSQGKAYMYLQKPVNDLQFIQSIRNSVEFFESQQKVKSLQKNLTITLTELKKMRTQPKEISEKPNISLITFISDLITQTENLYFSAHNQNVVLFTKTLGEELHLSEKRLSLLESASKIHMFYNIAMPERLKLFDPYQLEDDDYNEYFIHFRKSFNLLKTNKEIEQCIKIIEQIWERQDGTGYPAGIAQEFHLIESQILAIAVIYDNITYRLPFEKLSKFRQSPELIQTQVETIERHNEALKFIYRNSHWFNKDLMRIFTFIEKNKTNSALVPKRGDLKIKNREYVAAKINTASGTGGDERKEGLAIVKIGDRKFAEKPIMIEDLKPGMIVSNNIVAKSGMLIVPQEQKLTENLIQNIQQLFQNDQLRDSVSILVPYTEKD